MKAYLRLIRSEGAATYSPDELLQVQAVLRTTPGVLSVGKVEKHQRGGYAVGLDVEQESVVAISEHLVSQGGFNFEVQRGRS